MAKKERNVTPVPWTKHTKKKSGPPKGSTKLHITDEHRDLVIEQIGSGNSRLNIMIMLFGLDLEIRRIETFNHHFADEIKEGMLRLEDSMAQTASHRAFNLLDKDSAKMLMFVLCMRFGWRAKPKFDMNQDKDSKSQLEELIMEVMRGNLLPSEAAQMAGIIEKKAAVDKGNFGSTTPTVNVTQYSTEDIEEVLKERDVTPEESEECK